MPRPAGKQSLSVWPDVLDDEQGDLTQGLNTQDEYPSRPKRQRGIPRNQTFVNLSDSSEADATTERLRPAALAADPATASLRSASGRSFEYQVGCAYRKTSSSNQRHRLQPVCCPSLPATGMLHRGPPTRPAISTRDGGPAAPPRRRGPPPAVPRARPIRRVTGEA
jgi:hypothetical protein